MKILLVIIDTLRADHVGCYGYPKSITPNIDRLAAGGVRFANAFASDAPCVPSSCAMFTGRFGICTGIVSHGPDMQVLGSEIRQIQHVLSCSGHLTAAVSTFADHGQFFFTGWNEFHRPAQGMNLQRVTADDVNDVAIPWLRRNCSRDFLLHLHYWDPHTPYNIPDDWWQDLYDGDPRDPGNRSLDEFRDRPFWNFITRACDFLLDTTDIRYGVARYDAEIRYADDRLGEVLECLEELGIADETLVVVTTDHGESFGEWGVLFDHCSVHDSVMHAPLVMRHPALLPAGAVVAPQVLLLDLPATLAELAGIKPLPDLHGRSLLPLINGDASAGRQEIPLGYGLWSGQRAWRTREWKYVYTIDNTLWDWPRQMLFDLVNDPHESKNVIAGHRSVALEMQAKLNRWETEMLGERPDPLRLVARRGFTIAEHARRVEPGRVRWQDDPLTSKNWGPWPRRGVRR